MVGSRKKERFNELPVEAATRKSINANCGDASLEKDSCPEPGWQPPPQFTETTKQLFRVKNVQLPLTCSVLELMAHSPNISKCHEAGSECLLLRIIYLWKKT